MSSLRVFDHKPGLYKSPSQYGIIVITNDRAYNLSSVDKSFITPIYELENNKLEKLTDEYLSRLNLKLCIKGFFEAKYIKI